MSERVLGPIQISTGVEMDGQMERVSLYSLLLPFLNRKRVKAALCTIMVSEGLLLPVDGERPPWMTNEKIDAHIVEKRAQSALN